MASYGGVLEYIVMYSVNTSSDDAYLANYDVIMEDRAGMRLAHSGRYLPENTATHMSVNLTEDGWRHLEGSTGGRAGELVGREEFMMMLAGIDRLLVRASYHVHQTQAR